MLTRVPPTTHLDTNVLILGLVPRHPLRVDIARWRHGDVVLAISGVAWTEFLCDPVTADSVRNWAAVLQVPSFRAAGAFPNVHRRWPTIAAAARVRCPIASSPQPRSCTAPSSPHSIARILNASPRTDWNSRDGFHSSPRPRRESTWSAPDRVIAINGCTKVQIGHRFVGFSDPRCRIRHHDHLQMVARDSAFQQFDCARVAQPSRNVLL